MEVLNGIDVSYPNDKYSVNIYDEVEHLLNRCVKC